MLPVPLQALPPFLTRLGTLAAVLPWGMSQKPPWMVVDVVVQDEFTHDIVMASDGDPRALVLDCT
jgi:hypothetical protein